MTAPGIKILCNLADAFGCFEDGKQYYTPGGTICSIIAWQIANGYSLDSDDETIRDLMLAGF